MDRVQEALILRLWADWCKVWPEQFGHHSLQVGSDGFDPVFDLIPSRAYRDFCVEVAMDHPQLRDLNPFEVIDIALNQIDSPENALLQGREKDRVADVRLPPPSRPKSVPGPMRPQGTKGAA